MKKTFILLLIVLFVLSGCSNNSAPSLDNENISPVEALEAATEEPNINESYQIETQESETMPDVSSLKEKMALIGFEEVSGYYTRNAIEEDVEYMEMFSFEKNTFVRISTNDLEREVFAYNYQSDDFTYIYYFDGELAAKTKINVDTGAVLEDSDGYAELLSASADELKIYFSDLLEAAGLSPDELY